MRIENIQSRIVLIIKQYVHMINITGNGIAAPGEGVILPADIQLLLSDCPGARFFESTAELLDEFHRAGDCNETVYSVNGKNVTEAVTHSVSNGISVNFPDPYMRRRDPDTMVIADKLPTDKIRFSDRYGYDFSILKKETLRWLASQELVLFYYQAGRDEKGSGGIAVVPANALFFAIGLSMLQRIVSPAEAAGSFDISNILYVAPPFRHTHFKGRQVVVHNRGDIIHEVFAYNLYPGPSAKKGLYSVLLDRGEKEGWTTAHCSTVQAISPYDNITTFMHEGASGGGKSEMLQRIVREPEGEVLIGTNLVTGEKRTISIPRFCSLRPVSDDMALCPPEIQSGNGKLTVWDAENSWFIRVDSIKQYGDDPFLEKISVNPSSPLLFLNIESKPGCTALIWNHADEGNGRKCTNPRVIIPRDIIPGIVDAPVNVDVRSFGVRNPPCSQKNPSYGIMGIFHILPPSLAWLWRLVSPRGYANPSITDSGEMESEGVGSYWPFATGLRVTHANILLDQVVHTPRTRYILTPNQHIGIWEVGFKPQLLMREYLTRRGNAKLRSDQFQPARCSLLGYELNYLTIEGAKIPSRFLQVYKQPEVGQEGYDLGAAILYDFFLKELKKFLVPNLSENGRRIIEACLDRATVEEYNSIIPMDYSYSFITDNGNLSDQQG